MFSTRCTRIKISRWPSVIPYANLVEWDITLYHSRAWLFSINILVLACGRQSLALTRHGTCLNSEAITSRGSLEAHWCYVWSVTPKQQCYSGAVHYQRLQHDILTYPTYMTMWSLYALWSLSSGNVVDENCPIYQYLRYCHLGWCCRVQYAKRHHIEYCSASEHQFQLSLLI